jgi:hypothetical protein
MHYSSSFRRSNHLVSSFGHLDIILGKTILSKDLLEMKKIKCFLLEIRIVS